MISITKTYTDFNGIERTETKYFNLTESEIMEMELGTAGGVAEMLQNIIDAKDQERIIRFVKDFILKSYGEKSSDGLRFDKSEELSRNFSNTQFYNVLFMELATNDEIAADFVNGVIPQNMKKSNVPRESNDVGIPVTN